MSKNDLKRYLLAGAKDVDIDKDFNDGGNAILRRRNVPPNKRNRLSLDLPGILSGKRSPDKTHCERSKSDILAAAKRRSLNFDAGMMSTPKRRTVHFDLPGSPNDASQPYCELVRIEDEPEGHRSRSRKRDSQNGQEKDNTFSAGVNPHLLQLMEVRPQTHAEAQSLKKMLKRAVSGPDATFEDLKAYRLAMKKLRQFVQEEREKEYQRVDVERQNEFHNFMEKVFGKKNKLSSSSYGSSRFGSGGSSTTPSVSYLSALNRDRSSSRDKAGGYGSDYGKSGYGSGTGYGSGSGSNPYSSRYGDKGSISTLASKFGEIKSPPRSRDTSSSRLNSTVSSLPPYSSKQTTPSTYSSTRSRDIAPTSSLYSPPTTRSRDFSTRTSSPSASYTSSTTTTPSTTRSRDLSARTTSPSASYTSSTTTTPNTTRSRDFSTRVSSPSTSYTPTVTTSVSNPTTRSRDFSNKTSSPSSTYISATTRGSSTAAVSSPSSYTTSRSRDTYATSPSIREPVSSYSRSNSTLSSRTNLSNNDTSLRTREPITSAARSRTRELNFSSSSIPEASSAVVSSSYVPKYGRQTSNEKSGYTSDAKSGYGSDYNKSGYGSGYGSGSGANTYKRYAWSRSNSFIKDPDPPTTPSYRTYSRENSYLGSDTGSGTNWRSRVYGTDEPPSPRTRPPTSPIIPNDSSTIKDKDKTIENVSETSKQERPSAFKAAINKLSQETKENASKDGKKSDLLSPNAVKVLPTFSLNDVKLKNKAPADFSSGSDESDKEELETKKEPKNIKVENIGLKITGASSKNLQNKAASPEKKFSNDETKNEKLQSKTDCPYIKEDDQKCLKQEASSPENVSVNRPFRHLGAVPPLPTRREVSTLQSLAPTPVFKHSDKYATNLHELARTPAAPSKWAAEAEHKRKSPSPCISPNVNDDVCDKNSLIPNKSSPTVERKSLTSPSSAAEDKCSAPTLPNKDNLGIANKDCRKSVLNMDIHPENLALIRRQQEERREELRRLRRQGASEDSSRSTNNVDLRGSSSNENDEKLKSQIKTTEQNNINHLKNESDESSESADNKRDEKPPLAPAVEKTSSRSKVVERKHSRGKGDSIRKSDSIRRTRERQSSHTSRTSSTSSSDNESEARSDRNRTGSFTRTRKRGSRDDLIISVLEGHRSRNNSGSLVKASSKSNTAKPKSRNNSKGSLCDKSSNNSRNSVLGDKKLTLGPDIDIGENVIDNCAKSRSPNRQPYKNDSQGGKIVNGIINAQLDTDIYPRKPKPQDSSSSSSSSESSGDSSESAGEEGRLFSISKSKSLKKSKAGLNKVLENGFTLRDIGERTSPDGKENVSRNNSCGNLNNDENGQSEVVCTFNLVLPCKKKIKPSSSNKSVSAELKISEWLDDSPSNSLSNVASYKSKSPFNDNTECDITEIKDFDATEIFSSSKSSSKGNLAIKDEVADGYEQFVWPSGSPELPRKKVVINVEDNQENTTTEGLTPFNWEEGSPVLQRKKTYVRTDWDTETETELDLSDEGQMVSKSQMPQVEEETEDDVAFEWPSSPEVSRRYPFQANSGYDTQNDTEAFEWPSSPDLPKMKDPQFISFTTDIDNLLNDGTEQETFIDLEKKLGFSTVTEDDDSNNKKESTDVDEKSMETNSVEDPRNNVSDNKDNMSIEDKLLLIHERAKKNLSIFIDKQTNIDAIIGTVLQPLTKIPSRGKKNVTAIKTGKLDHRDSLQEIDASEVKVHDAQANRAHIDANIEEIDASAVIIRQKEKREAFRAEIIKAVKDGLDDATLQVYRDGDYGTYLDLESSLAEQADDIDGLTDSKKNAIILRTQLSVRVHAIIEKLLNSDGRELRRALFSLKQIFQDDKDLVHAFVLNGGLKCLVKVGASSDHNYQTYILRALGQVMLYVDGMTGISQSRETIQWLYSLVSSRFRLVVKTALKLLLVFVEYSEYNARILVKAIEKVDKAKGERPWIGVMRLLEGKDCPDTELQIYAMTLVNKTLNGLPDQDSYYDQTDYLEEHDMELLIQKLMHNPNSDLDLLQQLTIYEAVLAYEDGDDVCRTRTIDPSIRQGLRYSNTDRDDAKRRKSKRHCDSNTPSPDSQKKQMMNDEAASSSEDEGGHHVTVINIKGGLSTDSIGGIKYAEAGVTPALRRRRERAERQKTFLNEQEQISESRRDSQTSDSGTVEDENRKNNEISWLLELMQAKKDGEVKDIAARIASLMDKENIENCRKLPIELTSDSTVKEILEKLSRGASLTDAEQEKLTRLGDPSGRIQKAKGGLLNKSHSRDEIRVSKTPEPPKKSENDLHWENLVNNLNRPLELCDLNFSDLNEEDDKDIFEAIQEGIPPPPPPPPLPPSINGVPPPPPMAPNDESMMVENGTIPPPPPQAPSDASQHGDAAFRKSKKTIKLFWKEVRDDVLRKSKTIWDNVEPVKVDVQKMETLFESKAKDINTKKQQENKGIKEVIVLDSKRSNMINIGMTKLPPPRTIKTAILKMDSSIINREGIEKLLSTMLPTAEEKKMIQEAAMTNPELPLGSAEQFLMMLGSISELPARLKLWLFKLDFEIMEKEVAEPLMDLKQGIVDIQKSRTFSIIMAILLSMGNFLNNTDCKGFQIDYLSKVPEVKDTVHKHSLLHHLCHLVIEKFTDTTDLYSEFGAITRASKVDFDELQNTIEKMETECKASWDYLKAIAKHDGPTQMKLKMSEFLADGAERIIVLGIIYRRVLSRFKRFLLWLGMPPNVVLESKAQNICSILSEFALEYRTCRERVLQQIEKKASHRERNKTRGKMITEMEKFKVRPKTKEEEADKDLRQLLNYSDVSDTEAIRGKNTWRRTREGKTRSRGEDSMAEMLMMGVEGVDDALLDSLVKSATKAPTSRTTPRERKRSRNADRKSSVKRSRTRDRNLISELEALQAAQEKIIE